MVGERVGEAIVGRGITTQVVTHVEVVPSVVVVVHIVTVVGSWVVVGVGVVRFGMVVGAVVERFRVVDRRWGAVVDHVVDRRKDVRLVVAVAMTCGAKTNWARTKAEGCWSSWTWANRARTNNRTRANRTRSSCNRTNWPKAPLTKTSRTKSSKSIRSKAGWSSEEAISGMVRWRWGVVRNVGGRGVVDRDVVTMVTMVTVVSMVTMAKVPKGPRG